MMHSFHRGRPAGRLAFLFLLLLPLLTQTALGGVAPPPWLGVALDGYPLTGTRLEAVAGEVGRRPDLVVFFLQWPAEPEAGFFPWGSLDAIWETGAVPCLTWEPMVLKDGEEQAVPWRRILEGDYDPYLVSFAEQAAAWGRPLVIRPAHEMNLVRYHWGTTRDAYGPESPAIYRRMFRYIVGVFDEAGADNVLWAFCPNAESVPRVPWNRVSAYYPGDDCVDVLGMDGYNWGCTQTLEEHGWDSRWRSFREIFASLRSELRRLAPGKPLLVFETATVGRGAERRAWIREAGDALRAWGVRGVVWFQADKEQDWRLTTEEADLLVPHRPPGAGRPDPIEWMQERTQ